MTNHPNRGMSYWLRFPRNFGNEYDVGIATTKEDADHYEAEEYTRIDRDYALRLLSRRAGNGEQIYAVALIDGQVCDRYETARAIRTGRGVAISPMGPYDRRL